MEKIKSAVAWLKTLLGKNVAATESKDTEIPCCSDKVHIAYRGVSDERLYIARNRTWYEVRFYKPNGLRVFCAVCRRRVY